jgi:internalin A
MNVSLSDLAPLAGLTSLERLYLSGNTSLTDVSPLAGLTNLTELDLAGSAVQDVSALAGVEGLFINR